MRSYDIFYKVIYATLIYLTENGNVFYCYQRTIIFICYGF